MAPGTAVELLGTVCLVELEVSIACSKKSDSLTRLDVAWLPDTSGFVPLVVVNRKTTSSPHQTAQVSLPWPCLLQLQMWRSGYDKDVTDGGGSTTVGVYHDR